MIEPASLAPWLIIIPLAGGLLAFLLPSRSVLIGLSATVANGLLALAITFYSINTIPLEYALGGWPPPAGILLRIDGLTLVMLTMTAITGLAISIYAQGYFPARIGSGNGVSRHGPQQDFFWPLWLMLLAGLNGLFLAGDLFNLYVTLEVTALAAVALTALSGKHTSEVAALRYLLVSLLGSLSYLFGTVLLYRACHVLHLATLGALIVSSPVVWSGLALITVGLLLKTALFPMHFWLPPAHVNALTPVSAILSALVIKASFYLIFRFWGDVFMRILPLGGYSLLGGLGAAAVLWGGIQALRQKRLKMLIAYSTVAQLGYLFIALPIIRHDAGPSSRFALVYLIISHAGAKAAMFLAAGNVFLHFGHDRINELAGVKDALPMTSFALAVAGVSLMGLPPSGGFIGKWLLLTASFASGQWWWGIILIAGSLLAVAYIYRVVRHLFTKAPGPSSGKRQVARTMEASSLFLAVLSLVMGIFAPLVSKLIASDAVSLASLLAGVVP
ncbi:MAG: oxidoreductase [Proteobacteria bacterium]|nr:oxidoreductase [Pseudomonadota bacterium]MBU1686926.1 oxidoreductase [Pseudomonadota bacterium]